MFMWCLEMKSNKKQIWDNRPQDVGLIVLCKEYVDRFVMRYVNFKAEGWERDMARMTKEMKEVLFKIAQVHSFHRLDKETDDEFVERIKYHVKNNLETPRLQVLTLHCKDGSKMKYSGAVQMVPGYTPEVSGMDVFEVDILPEHLWKTEDAEKDKERNTSKKTNKAHAKKTAKRVRANAKKRSKSGN